MKTCVNVTCTAVCIILSYGCHHVLEATIYNHCWSITVSSVHHSIKNRGSVRVQERSYCGCPSEQQKHVPANTVAEVNITHVQHIILENRRVRVYETAATVNINVGSMKTTIHEHLLLKKRYVC